MNVPQWVKQVLQAHESRSLDSKDDREAVALAITVGVQNEREQVVAQIAAWLDKQVVIGVGPQRLVHRLAEMVRRGDWS